MNRTARRIATSAAASAVALALTAPTALADDRERHEGDRNAYSAGQERGDDGRAAARGANGHGDGDERHDGRHQKWGGEGSESDDDAADDSMDESGTEESGTEESGTESEDTRVQGSAAEEDGAEERRQWSRGHRGHGENDERHDGRHEKWGGQGVEDGDEVEAPGDTDEGETDDGTTDEATSDDGTAEDGTSDDGTAEDGTSDDGTAEDGTSDGFAEDQARMLDRLTEAQAFLTDLRERIAQAEMEPTLQQTLLGLVDARLATISDLIAQVESATSYDDLRPSETDQPDDGATDEDTDEAMAG